MYIIKTESGLYLSFNSEGAFLSANEAYLYTFEGDARFDLDKAKEDFPEEIFAIIED